MKIVLMQKLMAVTSPIKELVIPGEFADYYSPTTGVNESLLLENLPTDFAPKPIQHLSVWVETENQTGSTGKDSSEGLFANAESWDSFRLLLCRQTN